jgi:hypothetical protein
MRSSLKVNGNDNVPGSIGPATKLAMAGWYQRRTQKGIGRTEKITLAGVIKNPCLWRACNTTGVCAGDMDEFFLIDRMDENDLKKMTIQRKTIFPLRGHFFT